MPALQTLFSAFSLGKKEQLVFSTLLARANGVTALQIARKLNLPRPTIYDNLNALIEKNLVIKSIDQNGSRFVVVDSETISSLLEEQIDGLKKTLKKLPEVLSLGQEPVAYTPRFSFYNEKNIAEIILRDVLRSREKSVYGFWAVQDMLKTISPEKYAFFHEERIRRNIFLYTLWPYDQKVNVQKNPVLGPGDRKISLREIRVMPKGIKSFGGYAIYGNKIGFISSFREGYGFIIDSVDLSQTILAQFKYIWSKSKPVKSGRGARKNRT